MKKNNEKGQALLELIIFLPLIFTIYTLVTGFANAIFGSINQQKFTRAYFYYRVQNNSTIPRRPDPTLNWKRFGMTYVGWREKLDGDEPMSPCYKITIPVAAADGDSCENEYTSTDPKPSTQFMRIGTAYGFCGATYDRANNIIFHVPHRSDLSYNALLDRSSCTITE